MMRALSRLGDRTFYLFMGAAAGAGAFVAHGALAGRPFIPLYTPPSFASAPSAVAPSTPKAPGQAEYEATCGSCHQANGGGLTGVFPPLAGSPWVTGDAPTPIRIALLGLRGPIDVGNAHFDSTMPSLGLDDPRIATILSYVRSAWGNSASPVTPADVAAVRAQLAGRSEAFDVATLEAMRAP